MGHIKAIGAFTLLCIGALLVLLALPFYAIGMGAAETWRSDIVPQWRRLRPSAKG